MNWVLNIGCKRNEVAKLQRESPDINSHVLLDLSDRERDFLRTKRWKALQARKLAEKGGPEMTFMSHTHRSAQPPHGQQIEFLFRDELSRSNHDEYPGVFGLGNLSEGIKNIRDEYSVAVSRYPGAKPKPRHFYTKEGFMKALKTGNLPQGMHFLDDSGTYIDKYGVIRNNDGPFWPVESVPMFSTPRFKWWTALSPEPLYFLLPRTRRELPDCNDGSLLRNIKSGTATTFYSKDQSVFS
ncbi:hypothetical protein RRG08_057997 [Elysia crispata]|uniref:Uncharacterized protein n=1 Tax=Elysia crispata TaxID=231223 RepID=A0AAE1DXI6_9GAST|nr:hypothetical protein RRG08_057997 [Elysia crispata]